MKKLLLIRGPVVRPVVCWKRRLLNGLSIPSYFLTTHSRYRKSGTYTYHEQLTTSTRKKATHNFYTTQAQPKTPQPTPDEVAGISTQEGNP